MKKTYRQISLFVFLIVSLIFIIIVAIKPLSNESTYMGRRVIYAARFILPLCPFLIIASLMNSISFYENKIIIRELGLFRLKKEEIYFSQISKIEFIINWKNENIEKWQNRISITYEGKVFVFSINNYIKRDKIRERIKSLKKIVDEGNLTV